jgi:hypothetical protein
VSRHSLTSHRLEGFPCDGLQRSDDVARINVSLLLRLLFSSQRAFVRFARQLLDALLKFLVGLRAVTREEIVRRTGNAPGVFLSGALIGGNEHNALIRERCAARGY